MGSFVNLSRPSLRNTTVERPERVRLPSGYTLFAFPDCTEELGGRGPDYLRVSVYPPGSDCADADDRIAELWVHREDADILLRMCAPPFPGKDGDGGT